MTGRGWRAIVGSMLPVIDMAPLRAGGGREGTIAEIAAACREHGFFYVVGHGVAASTVSRLAAASARFFALREEEKLEIAMARAGRAWRGYFPVGGELTSGAPDRKEGLYFGTELADEHPRVRAGVPLHGSNLYPRQVPELRGAVEDYMRETTAAAHVLMAGIAAGLGLPDDYFNSLYTREPTILFRVFHYPANEGSGWGVGEHTDYGLLTLLWQDDAGGLQVRTPRGWTPAPPVPGSLVCNLGDMLDRLTGGYYRSTPHRVKNVSGRGRLAFPLFFDPDFSAEVQALPRLAAGLSDDAASRWDQASVHAFRGTYGEYLVNKVGKVFPDLTG